MANKTITMSKLRQVLKHHFQGTGSKTIANTTGVSRNTVKKYLAQVHYLHLTSEAVQVMSDQQLHDLFRYEATLPLPDSDRLKTLFDFFDTAGKQLRRRGVTLLHLWHEYISLHPDGFQQTSYYKYYGVWKKRAEPSMHIEHKAGDKMYIDFAGEKIQYVDPHTGEILTAEVFVAILGASQLTYVEAVMSQRVEDLIMACENALHYFGGAPAAIVPDNLKAAVIKSNKYEPRINENFEAFADHYNMAVIPARAYKPKDKALVEGAVKISYRRIYAMMGTQLCTGLEELNTKIKEYLEAHNNKTMQGRNYSRRQHFEEVERHSLQPLAKMPFELFSHATLTVMKNGHICLTTDKHYYSVPYSHIGKKVRLMFSNSKVMIYYRYELIAEHKRIKSPHSFSTIAEHLASHHRHQLEWSSDKFIEDAAQIDPVVEYYIRQVLHRKPHPEQAYRSCQGILSYAKRVGKDRLVGACKRAHEVGTYSFKAIESILQKGLDNHSNELPITVMPLHDNIRGKDYYQ
jgi:transposase